MIDVTYLYAGVAGGSTPLRYGRRSEAAGAFKQEQAAGARRPVVVWNVTRRCNLYCVHCYSDSSPKNYEGELTTDEGRALLDDLAAFKIPAVLLSGGEPLIRPDLFDLVAHARDRGLRVVLSTNGTLVDARLARRIHEAGFSYVGISLDGIGPVNDAFRGRTGAYDRALRAIRLLQVQGQKVGLRLTMTKSTIAELPAILDLVEKERIARVCFYHLVPSGRGADLITPAPESVREAVDAVFARARLWAKAGLPTEVLTVGNPCDGVYLLSRLVDEGDPRAAEVEAALKWNGGGRNGPGTGLACVDPLGFVHPDQFWWGANLGNVRARPFSAIWSDASNPILSTLRDGRPPEGRCGACRLLPLCGGGFRARALALTGNIRASDPSCYLANDEICVGATA